MATNNNYQAAQAFSLQFKEMLPAVFQAQAYFGEFFGGSIEVLDGVSNNETAFYVKTSDIPVVIQDYDTGANVAFGTGTSNSSRFGELHEITYSNTPVPYDWTWAFHEGLDRFTVNNGLEQAVADRLDLQAQRMVKMFNEHHGKFISDNAIESVELAEATSDKDKELLNLFNELSKHYVNVNAVGDRIANVNTDLYNRIVDHPLTTTAKNSTTNIDENGVVRFKGFTIRETPDELFEDGEVAYVYIANIGKAFTGINTTRTIDAIDFDGVQLQGAGKAGQFMLDDNKKAVLKVTASATSEGEEVTPEG